MPFERVAIRGMIIQMDQKNEEFPVCTLVLHAHSFISSLAADSYLVQAEVTQTHTDIHARTHYSGILCYSHKLIHDVDG